MKRWNHRLKLPTEAGSILDLESGERPLAWAPGRDGQWYVGTDLALHLVGKDGSRRIGWENIERGEWHGDEAVLEVVELAGWGQPEKVMRVELSEAGLLLQLIRERVTKSVVVTAYAAVRGRRGLTVVGRRSPVGDGPVTWSYVLAEGLDPDDELVRGVADRALREAKAELP
ncbi:MAG: hypothetical protein H0V49_10550 [Nocardioidaceae bacterium]|nr:hypothetical protein [Nocardioidaceae bacterium]